MITPAAPSTNSERSVPALSRSQAGFDVLLAVVSLAASLVVHLSGSESVPANRDPGAVTMP